MGRTAEAYKRLLLALLPPGKAFNREPGQVLDELFQGKGRELARVDGRVEDLIQEDRILQTSELLDEHLADLGLPDECDDLEGATDEQQRAAAHARLTATGGLDKAYYIDRAAEMGYTITIDEFVPAWAGLAKAGDTCGGQHVLFFWRVNVIYDPLSPQEPGPLRCYLEQRKPAHTVLVVALLDPGFSQGFSSGFSALPVPTDLTGGYNRGFGVGFDICRGGGFDFDAFDDGFNRPR